MPKYRHKAVVLDTQKIYNTYMEYKDKNGVVYGCRYHVAWCPKYRRKVLVGDVAARLKELVRKTCKGEGIGLLELKVMPDSIYLLLETDPQYGIHKAVKTLKANTSRILREEFRPLTTKLPTLWTNSYFVSTVGSTPLAVIKQYIENQKKV